MRELKTWPGLPPLEEVHGSEYCLYTVVENKLAAIYRNQERIYAGINVLYTLLKGVVHHLDD